MKKIILVIMILSLINCENNNKSNNAINDMISNNKITAKNIVEKITREVKHYKSEPIYVISFDLNTAYFEVYIDDIQIYNQFMYYSGGSGFDINQALFKKGKHEVTYKMYPVGKTEEGDVYNTFPDFTYLKFQLASYDKQNKEDRGKEHMEHRTPYTMVNITPYDKGERFVAAGKDYYEGSFEIEVDVPFNITPPFANARDLRKMERKELERKLLKSYENLRKLYQSKDEDIIASLVYHKFKDQMVSEYVTKNNIQEGWNEIKMILIDNDNEILPIENYELEFFANGKLVALFSTNKDTRRGNALLCKVKSGEFKGTFLELKHYFYIPEGETEFKVY